MWQEWYLSKRTPEDRIEHGGVYNYLSARCVIDVTITDSDQRSATVIVLLISKIGAPQPRAGCDLRSREYHRRNQTFFALSN
jgi:hypothetical protein